MANCEWCGHHDKPSWSCDWFIPHCFCSEDCYNKKQEYDEEMGTCTCRERGCKTYACKGKCGCKLCHNLYQDFLSYE